MNSERLKEIAQLCDLKGVSEEQLEKFAKVIIRECLSLVEGNIAFSKIQIAKRFGV